MKQLELLKKEKLAYGGELLKTREGRSHPRPLSTSQSMHLVLRSKMARGRFSFFRQKNKQRIEKILHKFATKNGIQIISAANVGNHLHLHLRLKNRQTYRPFIRAVTAAVAMAITGASRWNKGTGETQPRFWDYRPYSRVIVGRRSFLNLRDYIRINQLEGAGFTRDNARMQTAWENSNSNRLNVGSGKQTPAVTPATNARRKRQEAKVNSALRSPANRESVQNSEVLLQTYFLPTA